MFACERQLLKFHIEWDRLGKYNLLLLGISRTVVLSILGKRIQFSVLVLCKLILYHRVVVPEYKCIFGLLVLQNTQFCVYIVLHFVSVAVEMVGGYVQKHRNIGTELIHVVKLETAQLYNVVILITLSNLQCQATADVSGQAYIESCLAENVIYE